MGVCGQHHAPAALPPGKTRSPLYRRLGGSQGRSGRVLKISPPTGIRYPDRPARSESLYGLSYRGPIFEYDCKAIYRYAILWWKQVWFLQSDPRRCTGQIHYGSAHSLDGKWSATLTGQFAFRETATSTDCAADWMSHTAVTNSSENRNVPCRFLGLIHHSPAL